MQIPRTLCKNCAYFSTSSAFCSPEYVSALAFSQHCSALQGHWLTGASLLCLRRSCLGAYERDEKPAVAMVRALLHTQMIKCSKETPNITKNSLNSKGTYRDCRKSTGNKLRYWCA